MDLLFQGICLVPALPPVVSSDGPSLGISIDTLREHHCEGH